ncbi:MAG TPA: VWA domain-containing protein [Myxococcota bacterium]
MRFTSPLMLVLLVLVPVLLALWNRDERSRARRMALLVDAGLLTPLATGLSQARRGWRRGLALTALFLVVIAAAGPEAGGKTVLLPQRGLDVLFVVDVSRSMRARDVLPDRLERAKAEISSVLPRFAEHRVGVVAFAGTAFVQCPLTTDVEAVRLFLNDLSPESVPQGGTALAAGLEVALNAIRAEDEGQGNKADGKNASAGRVIVVVTDGEDHEGGLDDVAKELKETGATVVLIGVGSTLGEPIPVLDTSSPGGGKVTGYVKDRTGQTVMTRMSPEVLSEVATQVGGVFIDGTSQPDMGLREVEAKIAGLEKRDLESRTETEWVDRTWIPLLLALLSLLTALAMPERRSSSSSSSRGVA